MRSYTYLMKGDLDRARLDYDKSSELDPREDSPFVRRGYALCLKRQFDAAEADYTNAIEWKSMMQWPMLAAVWFVGCAETSVAPLRILERQRI